MADEDLDLELEDENITREKDRNKKLADKVKATSEERDTLAKAKEEEAKARVSAEKERDFFKNFNQVSAKYQGASEYQDKILEKVNAGYSVEDATTSILIKEGKYNPAQPKVESEKAAGGSATTTIKGSDDKTPEKMSQDERRAALLDYEAKGQLSL